jgi:hypothetical protein
LFHRAAAAGSSESAVLFQSALVFGEDGKLIGEGALVSGAGFGV